MNTQAKQSLRVLSLLIAFFVVPGAELIAQVESFEVFSLQTTVDHPSTKSVSLIQRHARAVPLASCFPIDGLSDESEKLSRKLLLDALDSEALYTIVGDLKPISEGFFDTWFRVDPADTTELSKVRRAMSAWQCGDYYESGILPFQHLREGERFASGWIASRPAIKRMLDEHGDFFGRLGMTGESTAEAILLRIEGADDIAERWRGFGLVFGYPQPAIDFFVRAGVHFSTTGEFVERDFRNYPTHARSTGGFVYAVPRLEPESESEKLLRRKVEGILTLYRALRTKYIVDDNPARVVELIRDWFDDGTGHCHPDHALQKAMAWNEAREWVENEAIHLTTVLPTESLDDLKQLDPVLKDRRIIALGESTHGTREFFQLRHRMFRHLVENHGVRLFGIEASFAACLPIDEYVQTGAGDPRAALKGQGFWTWETEEVLELVEWMREWNRNRPADTEPVRFYGFDTQDAYTPLKLVLDGLQRCMPDEASKFRERLSLALKEQYGSSLSSATREQLQSLLDTIAELHSVCDSQAELPPANLSTTRLLLQKASSAIKINLSELEQWSSMGMVREVELYSRIRANLPKLDSELASLQGQASASLMEFVRDAADLKRCQLRFRDEMNEEQRQAWRDAVQWGSQNARSKEVEDLLLDLQQFLDVSTEYLAKSKGLSNSRDKSMASLVTAILDMHGDGTRIMLWAHDWHISRIDGNPIQEMPRLGTYLKREYGSSYLPVGLSFGTGGFQSKYYPEAGEDPAKMVLREFKVNGSRHDSFSHLFDHNSAPVSAYLLSGSFNKMPPSWFDEPHVNRTLGAAYQPKLENSDSYYERMVLADHFDVVFHVRRTERSRPLSPGVRFRFGAEVENDVSSSLAAIAALENSTAGVLVKSVASGSLAERSGLRAGDRIIRLGDIAVATPDRFNQMLADINRPGSQEITVLRDNQSTQGREAVQELTFYLIIPPWVAD